MKYIRATVELSADTGEGPATDVWVPNTWEHEQALWRLINAIGYGAVLETTDTLPEGS